MGKLLNISVVLGTLFCLGCVSSQKLQNVTLIVFGRSGTGISSTVQELIGHERLNGIIRPTVSNPSSLIEEYAIPVGKYPVSFLNIVDVAGMVEGRTLAHDVKVLSQLKTYILDPLKLNGAVPNSILFVSKFDDNRFDGPYSELIKTLGRLETLQKSTYDSVVKTDIAMVATGVMPAIPAEQRRPGNKIQAFKDAISSHTPFSNICISIGENRGREYNLPKVNGSFVGLPNHEVYPANVIESLASLADPVTKFALNSLLKDRRGGQEVILTNYNSSDYELEFELRLNQDLQTDQGVKVEMDRSLDSLIKLLNLAKITKKSQLPRTAVPKAALFQILFNKLPSNQHKGVVSRLKTLFDLNVPRFTKSLVVGNGYDYIQDVDLPTSPFTFSEERDSPLGYKLPSYLNCALVNESDSEYERSLSSFMQNIPEYLTQRRKLICIKGQTQSDCLKTTKVTTTEEEPFPGVIKRGYNVLWDDLTGVLDSVSAVQEFRTVQCELEDLQTLARSSLSEDFIKNVRGLAPVDKGSRESVGEWRSFFYKYGSHIVVKGYGGGYFVGSVTSQRLRDLLKEALRNPRNDFTQFEPVCKKLLDFEGKDVSNDEEINYSFYGGRIHPMIENAQEIKDKVLLKELVDQWKRSLYPEPIMLLSELTLVGINKAASLVDIPKGKFVEMALELLLNNNLEYERPRLGSRTDRPPPQLATAPTSYQRSASEQVRKPNTTTTLWSNPPQLVSTPTSNPNLKPPPVGTQRSTFITGQSGTRTRIEQLIENARANDNISNYQPLSQNHHSSKPATATRQPVSGSTTNRRIQSINQTTEPIIQKVEVSKISNDGHILRVLKFEKEMLRQDAKDRARLMQEYEIERELFQEIFAYTKARMTMALIRDDNGIVAQDKRDLYQEWTTFWADFSQRRADLERKQRGKRDKLRKELIERRDKLAGEFGRLEK